VTLPKAIRRFRESRLQSNTLFRAYYFVLWLALVMRIGRSIFWWFKFRRDVDADEQSLANIPWIILRGTIWMVEISLLVRFRKPLRSSSISLSNVGLRLLNFSGIVASSNDTQVPLGSRYSYYIHSWTPVHGRVCSGSICVPAPSHWVHETVWILLGRARVCVRIVLRCISSYAMCAVLQEQGPRSWCLLGVRLVTVHLPRCGRWRLFTSRY
jgi:hypothetical protein